jgi:hypothetical protein
MPQSVLPTDDGIKSFFVVLTLGTPKNIKFALPGAKITVTYSSKNNSEDDHTCFPWEM